MGVGGAAREDDLAAMSLRKLLAEAHEREEQAAPSAREIIVDTKTGQARQAGATTPEDTYIRELKLKAEKSLYVFAKSIIGRPMIIKSLHKPVCDFIQACPPHRKGVLLPREHVKTVIVGQCLPAHILIQPKGGLYFPHEEGSEQKIMLCAETLPLAQGNQRVVRHAFTSNPRVRAFWPHRCYASERDARASAVKWNEIEIIIRREDETRDASVYAVGVGGAATGLHPSVVIKDDIIALEAANSPTVMDNTTLWHKSTRGMQNRDDALEFMIGTRWAVGDTYQWVQENDATVEWLIRSVIENGVCIYPRDELPARFKALGWDLTKVAKAKKDFGALFPLLYMNNASDPELTDFAEAEIRSFIIDMIERVIEFEEDDRDATLMERGGPRPPQIKDVRGMPLTRDTYGEIFTRGEYFRARAT